MLYRGLIEVFSPVVVSLGGGLLLAGIYIGEIWGLASGLVLAGIIGDFWGLAGGLVLAGIIGFTLATRPMQFSLASPLLLFGMLMGQVTLLPLVGGVLLPLVGNRLGSCLSCH